MTVLWYQKNIISYLLLPLSGIFRICILLRRWLYRVGMFSVSRLPVPVIIVGNLSVGGNGKTPLVIWLVEFLKKQGFKPGIISRGYGGTLNYTPHLIVLSNTPQEVGDEPLLIAKATHCPVIIGRNRVAAGKFLLSQTDCNVIISDDGLQHYALARDLEIVAVDGIRRFGNGFCLPAGPLREPITRLKEADFIVITQGTAKNTQEYSMALKPTTVYRLVSPTEEVKLDYFKNQKVHAVAGIGNPERFFITLREEGLEVIPHIYPDHAKFNVEDFQFDDSLFILITEKDAVKCQAISNPNIWVVRVEPELSEKFEKDMYVALMERLLRHQGNLIN